MSTSNPSLFFSVVVPTYNRLDILKKTLNCIERLNFPDSLYEVIVVDDGSSDGTATYLARLAQKRKLRYLIKPNGGPGSARNAGALIAKGEILAFTDQDCLPDPNWLSALFESYSGKKNYPVVAVGGRIEMLPYDHWLYDFYRVQAKRHHQNHRAVPDFLDTANASFHRLTFIEMGGFDERFPFSHDDVELSFRYQAAGYKLLTNQQAIVHHLEPQTLVSMLRKSFQYGKSQELFKMMHPEAFSITPRSRWRKRIRDGLEKLSLWAANSPLPMRKILLVFSVALQRSILAIPEIIYFVKQYLPIQMVRYRQARLVGFQFGLYYFLEWCEYLLKIVGEVVSACQITIQKEHLEEL